MKVAFAHDVPLIKNSKDQKFYNNSFNYELWKRYLKFSEELIVISRVKEITDIDTTRNSLSSGKGVEFVNVPSFSNLKKRITNKKLAKRNISKVLDRVDGVIVRLPSEVGKLTYEVALSKKIPVLVEMVGCPASAYNHHGSFLGKIYSPIAKKEYQKLLKKSKFTIYVTKEYLQKTYPTNGSFINASNVHLLRTLDRLLDKESEVSFENFIIGTSGSLNVNYKGLDTAIKSLKALKENNKNLKLKLEIVGDGDKSRWERMAIREGVFELIEFKGFLSSKEVEDWLKALDLYIQPSKTEGLPRAVIEAMSMGLPVIASNVGGIPELLNEKYLHNPNDYYTLANKIRELYVNPEERLIPSKENLMKSKEYLKDTLDKRRDSYYKEFKEYIISRRNEERTQ